MSIKNVAVAVALFTIFRLLGYVVEPRLSDAEIHRIVGDASRVSVVPPAGALRVVTWNIERGMQFERILATLRSIDADVVLLQEVDRFCKRTAYRDVARELATSLGMNWLAAGEFQEVGEARDDVPALTGQAILSRFPIDDPDVVIFREQTPMRWRFNPSQPRRGGRIALAGRTGGLTFFNVHVESGGDDALRQSQLDEVIARARRREGAAVIAGDFNNSLHGGDLMRTAFASARFADALADAAHASTHMRHAQPIDWIFVRSAATSAGLVERVDDASDHFPVIATISPRSGN